MLGRVISIVVCLMLCLGLWGCGGRSAGGADTREVKAAKKETGQGKVKNELFGLFDDEEQANEAAELYGIELLSYGYGVAVFFYEGDAEELIKTGEKKGWPELSLNQKRGVFDEVE